MSAAPILETRQAIVAALKADAAITALVPSGQIFGEKSDSSAWPFIRCSEFEASGTDEITANIHAFSRKPFADEAHQIAALVSELLDDLVLFTDADRRLNVEVTGTRLLADPEESTAWHSICSVLVTVAKDCAAA